MEYTTSQFTNEGMNELIRLINQMQDGFSQVDQKMALELPMIAVVGSQSSGKSSVLESFVGRDFLPRGQGIVTRRPLILQLNNHTREYAIFNHLPEKRFESFEDVRKEIQRETDREAGSSSGISKKPITLKVFSPNVLTLTLVDLPGLTKVAVGDQPRDIEELIRSMILDYISQENCIILAISPANVDIANSDALKLAREVDPDTQRTIGVLTKLDLMDKGTDARKVLDNLVFPLQKGYVGVVNRSQKDIDANKSISDAIAAEKKFLEETPAYRSMADRLGTGYLQRTLNKELARHIAENLPALRNRLEEQLDNLKKEREELEEKDMSDVVKRMKFINSVLRECMDHLKQDIEGIARDVETVKIGSGAQIRAIFDRRFPKALLKRESKPDVLRNKIYVAIENIHAYNTGLFTPDRAFETVCKGEIDLIKEPVQTCVSMVARHLQRTIDSMADLLQTVPKLREEVHQRTTTKLYQLEDATKEHMMFFIDCQRTYINKNNDNFKTHLQFNPTPLSSRKCIPGQSLGKTAQIGGMVGGTRVREVYSSDDTMVHMGSKTKALSVVLVKTSQGAFLLAYDSQLRSNELFKQNVEELGMSTGEEGALAITRLDDSPMFRTEHTVRFKSNMAVWREALESVNIRDLDKEPKELPADSSPYMDEPTVDSAANYRTSSKITRSESHDIQLEMPSNSTDPLAHEIENIRFMVVAYVKIVHNIVRDTVPKMIIKSLLIELIDYFPFAILREIEQEHGKDMETLLEESEEVKLRRQRVIHSHEAVSAALDNIRSMVLKSSILTETAQIDGPKQRGTERDLKHKRESFIVPEYLESESDDSDWGC